jgi:large subunit ribosomal protein L30
MIRAAIRLRSNINIKPDIKETLRLLRLNKVNHCVLVPSDKIHEGMLKKAKDYITWGEVKPEVLARMIVTRGRLTGNVPIDNTFVKKNTDFDTLVKLADAVANEKFKYTDIKDIKPLFRLHPPLQGHEGLKRSHKAGGALGYRGEDINDMILKMLGPDMKVEKKASAKAAPAPKAKPAAKAAPSKKPAPKKPAPAVKKAASKGKPAPAKKPAAKAAPKAPAKKPEPKKVEKELDKNGSPEPKKAVPKKAPAKEVKK